MKKEQNILESPARERYLCPSAKSVTLAVNGFFCLSDRQIEKNTTEMEEGDDNW